MSTFPLIPKSLRLLLQTPLPESIITIKSCWTTSLFSSIHGTKIKFCADYEMKSFSQTLVSKWNSPTIPCLNVALGIVESMRVLCRSTSRNWEHGKSLINTFEWSNTFGPDCSMPHRPRNVNLILTCVGFAHL